MFKARDLVFVLHGVQHYRDISTCLTNSTQEKILDDENNEWTCSRLSIAYAQIRFNSPQATATNELSEPDFH